MPKTWLKIGVILEDGFAKFKTLESINGNGINHWYHVTLKEGRNREARRLWESQGITVSRLIRIRFATVTLPRGLRFGKYMDLDSEGIKELAALVDIKL